MLRLEPSYSLTLWVTSLLLLFVTITRYENKQASRWCWHWEDGHKGDRLAKVGCGRKPHLVPRTASRPMGREGSRNRQKQTLGSEVLQIAHPTWHGPSVTLDQEGETKGPHRKLRETSAKGSWKEMAGRCKGTASLEQNVGCSTNSLPDLHLWIYLGSSRPMDFSGELGEVQSVVLIRLMFPLLC